LSPAGGPPMPGLQCAAVSSQSSDRARVFALAKLEGRLLDRARAASITGTTLFLT
jgi:hypothetical protein